MIYIFSIDDLIYIIKTIYTDRNLEDYKFKKTIQDKLDAMTFEKYIVFLERCELIAFNLSPSLELNSLNNLHIEIKENILKNLTQYIK